MSDTPYLRAAIVGASAGLRTFTAPAATLAAGGSRWARPALVVATGELVGDKLPMTPPRTTLPALGARIVSGAACGAAVSRRNGGAALLGALLGGVAAYASTFAGYTLRSVGAESVPDLPLALAEDALAIAAARYANRAAG